VDDGVIPKPRQDSAVTRQARLTFSGSIYDLIVFTSLAAVGCVFVYGALEFSDEDKLVGAGTVPMIAGGLLVILSVWGLAGAIVRRRDSSEFVVDRPFQVLFAMVLVLIFPPAMDLFGYYLTALFWVPAFAWIAGARSWITCLLVGSAVLVLAKFVFEMLLGTPLP
jgi:hypothetical protein